MPHLKRGQESLILMRIDVPKKSLHYNCKTSFLTKTKYPPFLGGGQTSYLNFNFKKIHLYFQNKSFYLTESLTMSINPSKESFFLYNYLDQSPAPPLGGGHRSWV
jgi:hypothetical protein